MQIKSKLELSSWVRQKQEFFLWNCPYMTKNPWSNCIVIDFLSSYESCRSQVHGLKFIINFEAAVLYFSISVVLLFIFLILILSCDFICNVYDVCKLIYIIKWQSNQTVFPLESVVKVYSSTLSAALYSLSCSKLLNGFRNLCGGLLFYNPSFLLQMCSPILLFFFLFLSVPTVWAI